MSESGIAQLIPLILIFIIFYFFLIRPQQKKVKEHKVMVEGLKRGDKVITSGGITGTIELTNEAFPGAINSKEVTNFVDKISTVIDGEPHINSNTALHTAAIYSTDFDGTVTVQGTLDANNTNSWFDISTETLTNPSTPHYVNFNGVFSNIRFKFDNTSGNSGTIDKILVRN